MRISRSYIGQLLSTILLCILCSCGPRVQSYPALANKGILALSGSNPYIGANLFLGKELENSPYLYSFFQSQGAPTAIELVQNAFDPAYMLLFYYPRKEVYIAELQKVSGLREWITRGPYAIERDDYRSLGRIQAGIKSEALFVVNGKHVRFRFTEQSRSVRSYKPPLPKQPTATPIPVTKAKKQQTPKVKSEKPKTEAKPTVVPTQAPPSTNAKEFRPLNADQQALNMAKGYAERASNGDVLHSVKSEDETISKIAGWYTGSEANAKEIASANGLDESKSLSPGMRIRIPLSIVKQFKALQ